MNKTITNHISEYLDFCQSNKRLDPKTVKAYKIDLTQFVTSPSVSSVEDISSENIKKYIANLHIPGRKCGQKYILQYLRLIFNVFVSNLSTLLIFHNLHRNGFL